MRVIDWKWIKEKGIEFWFWKMFGRFGIGVNFLMKMFSGGKEIVFEIGIVW